MTTARIAVFIRMTLPSCSKYAPASTPDARACDDLHLVAVEPPETGEAGARDPARAHEHVPRDEGCLARDHEGRQEEREQDPLAPKTEPRESVGRKTGRDELEDRHRDRDEDRVEE